MKSKLLLLVFASTVLLASCNDTATSEVATTDNTTTDANNTEETTDPKATTEKVARKMYAWVDKLRIREQPNLKAKEVVQVAEGTALQFNGEVSPNKEKITLRGREMNAPFYKVVTPDGKEGWVYAGALSQNPVDVQSYRVAIAFDDRFENPEEEDVSGDFGYYLSEAGEMMVGTGVDLIFADEHFHEVPIKNSKGEIIGTENISHFVKEHGAGIVCIEKGKKPMFVAYDPDMGHGVLDAFGMVE